MNRKIIIALFFLLTAAGMQAQESSESAETLAQTKKWSLVPKIGANAAWLTNDNADSSSPRYGLVLGCEFNYRKPNNPFGVSFGLLYSQQGIKEKERGMDITGKLDYFNFPLLLHYYVNKNFTLKFGLQPGINTKNEAEASDGFMSGSASLDPVRDFHLSVPFGFSVSDNYLVLDVRFDLGLTKWSPVVSSYHRVIQATIGYRFNL